MTMFTYAAPESRLDKRVFGLCWHAVISGNQPTR